MPDPVLQETLKVKVKDIEYEFRIPSLADEIRLGMHERKIRRELDPDGDGSAEGLDNASSWMVRSAAVMEVLLVGASNQWPYSKGDQGEPVVNFRKWAKERVGEAAAVGLAFQAALDKFRGIGASDRKPDGQKAVAGGDDPGTSQSVPAGSPGA
jgi:hypothetical protein